MSHRLVIAVLLALAAPTVSAQITPPVEPGQRVRITSTRPRAMVVGTVMSVDSEGLVLRLPSSGWESVVTLDRIERLDVSAGRESKGEGLAHGALTGLEFGALIGVTATALTYLSDADEECSRKDCFFGVTPVIAVAGLM